jgi:hypothetical protein
VKSVDCGRTSIAGGGVHGVEGGWGLDKHDWVSFAIHDRILLAHAAEE